MGWANASFLDAVLAAIGTDACHGRKSLARLRQVEDLPASAGDALRRYSRSEFTGQEDGKALNASLLSGNDHHSEWASELDAAFVWAFDRDVLLWRGFSTPPPLNEASSCFVSTSLVERQARRFKSRGGSGVGAIVLPAGSRVAVPLHVWPDGDARTLGIVKREVEIILPRGTSFDLTSKVYPFEGREPDRRTRVSVYRAAVPDLTPESNLPRP